MIYSIYHFFYSLVQQKELFKRLKKLDQFHFDRKLLSCKNKGVFPDLAIRVNKDRKIFTGGELIELKDSDSYTVSSFNSTIPSRSKKIEEIITGESSIIKQQMEKAGNDIFSLPIRDVFYLVRGRKKQHAKICLVYGSFFETISIENLISQSFQQVLEEQLRGSGKEISDELKQTIISILSQQQSFSKVRNVEKSSVKLRFRIMTEVKAEGNILNSKKYPEIKDDTLNFVLPCHNEEHEQNTRKKLEEVFSKRELQSFGIFKIKHHFNGYFLVLQTEL
ncbi:MAG: hypothetical protein COZ37_07405 [bacterium (Candidatus Ratteibacteria) CG_4_10_14_3_um_filter_41_18]|uniref:Uncharacterized protein n=4 Tax=Candidatus Ratteibacteria TaxID=2979319 RepID=A0A2M7YF35_9BACT|nr:MAG: hypothetical protein COS11_03275 [bacterium (Candidatus Ratteibacteria) CG01_land_8_20_14_3_00_40_19]PIW32217.1 MAG: hypothetical protein COW28_06435 [bacterium (Candidatus Ratteibacteria) CG15_BIG_FIL_POST_REV_8_21_14_020_41_12]PIX76534.1 MAG: hypothetical protein COZ37_07405 [bacterium (Candidatus Ratteibacteria) CG_4_10_14_3_um_filter_41_18]PJA61597.1 MAG: hypothetical protein CO162_05470 [bacterium (Candidatus Ratteibacteria) CG_4_9_14_3_um_filter_41_21]HCG77098.1 hypothetical prote